MTLIFISSFISLKLLINKIDFLCEHTNSFKLHVAGIAESWLLPSIKSGFVEISGYDVVRGDTDSRLYHGSMVFAFT